MSSRHYSSEEAFERLLRSVDRLSQRSLRRYELHKAAVSNGIKLTAPEIDFLFDVLTGFKNLPTTLLGQKQWTTKIFDESGNSLQVIRALMQKENIDRDKAMKIMDVKLWDPALDFTSFQRVIRRLEQSLSEQLCRTLFTKIQNNAQKVELPTLLANICGTEHETVDYKVKMFKQLYIEIFQNKRQREFLKLCEADDKFNDGKIEPKHLEKVLKAITGGSSSQFSDEAIQKFVK